MTDNKTNPDDYRNRGFVPANYLMRGFDLELDSNGRAHLNRLRRAALDKIDVILYLDNGEQKIIQTPFAGGLSSEGLVLREFPEYIEDRIVGIGIITVSRREIEDRLKASK